MTDKEKRELKDDVISIFKRFNILDHTATIGGLRDDILRYIDSLQEEPISEDLEKEPHYPKAKEASGTLKKMLDNITKESLEKARKQLKEKPVSKDLERVVKDLWQEINTGHQYSILDSYNQFYGICLDVCEWQKRQMMKDAFIFEDKHNTACILASECLRNHGWFNRERDFNNLWRFISGVNKLFEGEFKTGDKVKLIIIKEE